MSWDSYVDNLLAQCKDAGGCAHADKACIIGLDGGGKWTTDDHPCSLKIDAGKNEGEAIARCFKAKDFNPLMANGIYVEGQKYQFLRVEDDMLVLGKAKGKGSITLQCTKTAIVIGHCPEGMQQGTLNKGVAVIADYLLSLNM